MRFIAFIEAAWPLRRMMATSTAAACHVRRIQKNQNASLADKALNVDWRTLIPWSPQVQQGALGARPRMDL
jgi:hypothetical protein